MLEPLGDGTATGRIVGKAWFMWLRDQRVPRVSVSRFVRDDQHADTSVTEVYPFEVAGDYDAQLAVSLRVPDCRHLYWRPGHDDDHGTLWLIAPGSGAWASLRHHPKSDGPYEVRQHGSRRLWDEVEAAYHWWKDAGDPQAADWYFTITQTPSESSSTSSSKSRDLAPQVAIVERTEGGGALPELQISAAALRARSERVDTSSFPWASVRTSSLQYPALLNFPFPSSA
ncbi:MAG: hypothetical protein ACRDTA_00855 [Pseudonocardiaceae bacterium]